MSFNLQKCSLLAVPDHTQLDCKALLVATLGG